MLVCLHKTALKSRYNIRMPSFDIESAIAAHTGWRETFISAIEGCNADALKTIEISDPTQCVLGTWLHAPHQHIHAENEVFKDILRVHKACHEVAVRIVALLREGDVGAAEMLIYGDFDKASQALVDLIAQFQPRT